VSDEEYEGYIPLTVGMEDEGRTIQMDERGRGKELEIGTEEPPPIRASLTGPTFQQRLQSAAQRHQEAKRAPDVPPHERHAEKAAERPSWLTQYMLNEGLIEDPRFASAFEFDKSDETAVDKARERDDASGPLKYGRYDK
jgi:hypothetical protein